jgi:hypothetical protein
MPSHNGQYQWHFGNPSSRKFQPQPRNHRLVVNVPACVPACLPAGAPELRLEFSQLDPQQPEACSVLGINILPECQFAGGNLHIPLHSFIRQ